MMDLSTLQRTASNPGQAFRVGFALAKGFLVKARYLGNHNVTIGPGFRAYMMPRIIGPGRVVIGAHVSMGRGFLRRPCILTHTPDSYVSIGRDSSLGGTRISCVDSVRIGEGALLGSLTIVDSDVVPTDGMASDAEWCRTHARPVRLGDRVWAGINSFILGGAAVGDESVIGAGAVVQGGEVQDRSLLLGNPARRIGGTELQ